MCTNRLSTTDSKFLLYLRSLSIFVIVFGHVGGFWLFKPYSEFLNVFVPVFFFISGAVSLYSYERASNFIAYYVKRFTGLLVPYYLLCFLSLLVFLSTNRYLPLFDINNLFLWFQIRPISDISPFDVNQVWFLHTLFFIILLSPLYFHIRERSACALYILMLLFVALSGLQIFIDIDNLFFFFGNNLYKPLIHSSFYIFGIIYFSSSKIRNYKILACLLFFCSALCVVLVSQLDLNIDYSRHTFAPDLYYVAGSFATIFLFLIFQNQFLFVVQYSKLAENCFRFFYKHTFSIFLLHTFAMYLSETVGGLLNPPERTLLYGFVKFSVVLSITCILSVPFTKLSASIISVFLRKIKV